MPIPGEFHIQRAVCILLDKHGVPGLEYWHTPNGGSRGAAEGKRFKDLGVKPGVADLLLFYRGRLHCLELKDERGRLSDAQIAWGERLQDQGALWAWANSLAGAKAQLQAWGLLITC